MYFLKTMFFLVILVAAVISSSPASETENEKTWHSVGFVERKVFMVETSVSMNWTEARTLCEENEMKLASVNSAAQVEVLKYGLLALGLQNTVFWTSGRDAMTLRQYSWDDTDEQPSDIFLHFEGWYATMNSCLTTYLTAGDERMHFYPNLCSDKRRVMCQDIVY